MKPHRELRETSDIAQLKRQAKELLRDYRGGEPAALREVSAHWRGSLPTPFALHDAQLVLARSYGFPSWPKLKAWADGLHVGRLVELVRAGDVEGVERFLRVRPELANATVSYGDEHRPLHFAVMCRSEALVRLLMKHGASAREGIHPHRDATTALVMAEDREYDEIVRAIHEEEQAQRREASPEGVVVSVEQDEITAAILGGNVAGARVLLEADPTRVLCADREGWTPLHLAAAIRDPELTAWLIEHGAEVNRQGKDDRPPIDLAVSSQRAIDRDAFVKVANLLLKNGAAMTPRAATALGDDAWLRAHHDEGKLVNPVTWSSGGLLTVAVRHNQPETLRLLLSYGFDPDEQATYGEGVGMAKSQAHPLWHCSVNGREEMAKMLIAAGADVNAHVDSSGSPVYAAFARRQWGMVELLRKHGGIVGADTASIYRQVDLSREILASDGDKPKVVEELLEFACSGGSPEIAEMALARIDWPRNDARWPRYIMRCMDFWNHIPWLSFAAQELDRSTYIECLRIVLRRGDPNIPGAFGRTPLHEAAAMGDHVTDTEATEFVLELLKAGARTDVREDVLRSTPLGWACRWGREGIVSALLKHGADPAEADAEPWARPLSWAQKKGHASIVRLLTQAA